MSGSRLPWIHLDTCCTYVSKIQNTTSVINATLGMTTGNCNVSHEVIHDGPSQMHDNTCKVWYTCIQKPNRYRLNL